MRIEPFRTTAVEDLVPMEFEVCLSIYLPTHTHGTDTKEDPIRFKNLLRNCQKRLEKRGLGGAKIDPLIAEGMELLETRSVWLHLDRGLAVFIAKDVSRALTLPIECRPQAWIGTHFYIKPLVPLWGPRNRFCILALSRGQAKVYEADRWTMHEVALRDTPRDLEEFLRYDEAQEHIQSHTAPPGKAAGTAAMFHGQGNIADKAQEKRIVDEYLKAVRNGVEKYLGGDNYPLVLVAPEYIQSTYREISGYSYLLGDGVKDAPDHLDDTKLYEAARTITEPYFGRISRDRLSTFRDLLGSGKASDEIEQILPAAREGRVQTLLLDPAVSLTDEPEETADSEEEPLDLAVRFTLTRGGDVYAIDRQELSSRSPVGAILRY